MSSTREALEPIRKFLEERGDRVLALSLVGQVILAMAQVGAYYVIYRCDDGEHLDECFRMPEFDRCWREYNRFAAEVGTLRKLSKEGGAA